jgi:ubiquinone/menaquinone biosynthesis C-methylase UbiE
MKAQVARAIAGILISSLNMLPLQSILPSSINPDIIASKYNQYASSYDILDGQSMASKSFGINELRLEAAKYVSGNVLEVAMGTGLQTDYYDWNSISSYKGVDISPGMLQQAQDRLSKKQYLSSNLVNLHVEDAMNLVDEASNQVIKPSAIDLATYN